MPFVMLVCLFAARSLAQSDALRQEERALKGVWRVRVFEGDGQRLTAEEFKDKTSDLFELKWVFKVDRAIVRFEGDLDIEYVRYKLDPTAKPKAVDLDMQGQTISGVYRLENDKLTVCFSVKNPNRFKVVPGKEARPKDFTTKKDSERLLVILERQKP
jgi:uncharacterized protein (TIGR03067 family)